MQIQCMSLKSARNLVHLVGVILRRACQFADDAVNSGDRYQVTFEVCEMVIEMSWEGREGREGREGAVER